MSAAGYAVGQQQDVLADVLRPQLHQLRRLPDGATAACPTPGRGPVAATRRTGAPRCPKITDNVPAVGAVAWWKANTGPAGSAGHVAYVEKVVSADEIIVSQDSWGGDFSWAVITKASGNWPSGFVHFNDVKLVNKATPVVSGVAKVGAKLKATAGTWSPTDAKVSYQWYANGVAIPGATAVDPRRSTAAGSARRSGSAPPHQARLPARRRDLRLHRGGPARRPRQHARRPRSAASSRSTDAVAHHGRLERQARTARPSSGTPTGGRSPARSAPPSSSRRSSPAGDHRAR